MSRDKAPYIAHVGRQSLRRRSAVCPIYAAARKGPSDGARSAARIANDHALGGAKGYVGKVNGYCSGPDL